MENEINHVGIIMDGNRRWAKEKGLKSFDGHNAGANRIIELAKYVFSKDIKYLSIYAFSTENFKRTQEEVNYLMDLIVKFFTSKVNELNENNIKIVFSGRKEPVSDRVYNCLKKLKI